jgi:hypothetical protein
MTFDFFTQIYWWIEKLRCSVGSYFTIIFVEETPTKPEARLSVSPKLYLRDKYHSGVYRGLRILRDRYQLIDHLLTLATGLYPLIALMTSSTLATQAMRGNTMSM